VYWLPCLEDEDRVASDESRAYAGHFRFLQQDVLDHLPRGLRRYFGFMYDKRESSAWLRALQEDFGPVLGAQQGRYRMMYSTPLFFDLAGLGVTLQGDIRPKTEAREDWAYRFEPVHIHCTAEGVTHWEPAGGASNRHIFHVLDTGAYPLAMQRAMQRLLSDAFQ
jgi:hypothetical protein